VKPLPLDSYAYSLARLRWDVFGTLTFRSVPTPKRAYGRAWAFMRRAAELVQRPYSQLLVALRAECGELTGRFHFHFFLGGTQTRLQRAWRLASRIATCDAARQAYPIVPALFSMIASWSGFSWCLLGSRAPQKYLFHELEQ